jgi:hypothetical protein
MGGHLHKGRCADAAALAAADGAAGHAAGGSGGAGGGGGGAAGGEDEEEEEPNYFLSPATMRVRRERRGGLEAREPLEAPRVRRTSLALLLWRRALLP